MQEMVGIQPRGKWGQMDGKVVFNLSNEVVINIKSCLGFRSGSLQCKAVNSRVLQLIEDQSLHVCHILDWMIQA